MLSTDLNESMNSELVDKNGRFGMKQRTGQMAQYRMMMAQQRQTNDGLETLSPVKATHHSVLNSTQDTPNSQ